MMDRCERWVADLGKRMEPVIGAVDVLKCLDREAVAIADCRFSLADPALGYQQYAAGHLPGAVYFDLNRDLSSPVRQHGGRHPLPDPEQLARKLERAGVRWGETLVVAYDDARFAFAARFWWLLRYLGHDRVAVLDGGFGNWQAAGYPVTTEVPQPQPGQFRPQVRTEWVVEIEAVRRSQSQSGIVLVDSREGDRYRGEREPIDPVAGHIPGAVNFPWQDATTSEGYVRPQTEHQQRWSDLSTAGSRIVYCGSGVTACVNLLSLELAGVPNNKLYAGSWSDWCSYL